MGAEGNRCARVIGELDSFEIAQRGEIAGVVHANLRGGSGEDRDVQPPQLFFDMRAKGAAEADDVDESVRQAGDRSFALALRSDVAAAELLPVRDRAGDPCELLQAARLQIRRQRDACAEWRSPELDPDRARRQRALPLLANRSDETNERARVAMLFEDVVLDRHRGPVTPDDTVLSCHVV
jgi:hypothetical protein